MKLKKAVSMLLAAALVISGGIYYSAGSVWADEVDEIGEDYYEDIDDWPDDIDIEDGDTTAEEDDIVEVTSLAFVDKEVRITMGNGRELQIETTPEGVIREDLIWTSSDDSIAEVTESGQLVAIAVGTVTVTVSNEEGTISDTCTVTVFPPTVEFTKVVPSAKKMGLKWKMATLESGVVGYQIETSASKTFTGAKKTLIKKRKTTSTTIRGLNSGRTYYVRIRTYAKTSDGRIFSAWSKIKTGKVS